MPNDADTEQKRKWFTAKAMKRLLLLLQLSPIVVLCVTTFQWADSRYMHKQAFSIYDDIADFRYNDLQIRVLQGQITAYHNARNSGVNPTPNEEMQYNADVAQLANLLIERNKGLGLIGDTE